MRRALILPTAVCILAACGQTSPAPASAKETSAPTPTPSATQRTTLGAVLLDKSGSGSYRSNTFTTPGEWDLVWEGESAPDTTGSFLAITVYGGDGGPVASTIEVELGPPNSKKSDMAHMHYAGNVSIDIQGVGSWHVKAVTT